MQEQEIQKKAKQKSLLISAIYVSLGTVANLCLYTPYGGEWFSIFVGFLFLITFPVSVLGAGIMYTGNGIGSYLMLFGLQIIIFLFMWRYVYRDYLWKYGSKKY
jgi:hypothetical protein